jgi:multidrug resistance efflux pump
MTAKRRPHPLDWMLGIALLLLTAVGAGWVLNSSRAQDTPGRDGGTTPGDFKAINLGFVDVEPGVTNLYPTQLGRIVEVKAEENKAYKKGDVLLRVDSTKAERDLELAQAALGQAEEQLKQAETLPKKARKNKLEQQKALVRAAEHQLAAAKKDREYKASQYRKQNVNWKLVEQADEVVKAAAAKVDEARAGQKTLEDMDVMAKARLAQKEVDLRQIQVRQAKYALSQYELTAPEDGEVLRVLVNKGEVLSSQPKQPAIMFIPTSKPRIVRAEVEQEFAARVVAGNPAVIEDDTRAGRRWTGKVVRLSDWYARRRSVILEPLQFNDVRTMECIVSIDPGQPLPRIGQRMRVIIGRDR